MPRIEAAEEFPPLSLSAATDLALRICRKILRAMIYAEFTLSEANELGMRVLERYSAAC